MIDDFAPAKKTRPVKLDTTRQIKTPKEVQAEPASDEPAFKTPEEIAVTSMMGDPPPTEENGNFEPPKKKRFSFKDLIVTFKGLSKKKQALVIATIVLVLAAIGGGAYAFVASSHKHPVAAKKPVKIAPTPVKPVTSPLTGVVVTKAQSLLPVTAVMIENSPDARPQSGLKDAGVVYEAIAEGGITRFMALYQEAEPANIGPVRSSRPYYLRWALPFQAGYAHVGGSPDALADIKALGIRDLDQFYNSAAYHRISSREAPHNVYTSISALLSLEQSKGYGSSTFDKFARKTAAPAKTPTTTSIDLAISSSFYNVHYDYDAAANAYKRSEGGAAHMDADSNTQLEPKVVVALVLPYSIMTDGYHSMYNTVGTGKMYVFQDGGVTTGNWAKASDSAQYVFTNDAGKTLALDPGQTWITALGDNAEVTYR